MSEENKTLKPSAAGNTNRGFARRGGGPPMSRPVEKAKNFKGTLKRLINYLRPQRINLIIVVIFAVFATTFTVLGPKITGNAMNQLVDGFIAKSVVDGIDKAQPDLKTALDKYNDAIKSAKQQADNAVVRIVNKTVADQLQKAYSQAYAQADSIATQQFNAAIAAQKQAAYEQAKSEAETAAKIQVDQQFMALYPDVPADQLATIPGYTDALNNAYEQADASAVSLVDSQFAAMQPELDAQLAEAKKQAEAAAKAAVDAAFAANQPKINAQIASAKKTAEKAAIDAVNKAFMDEEGMTKEQLDAFLSLAAMPSIKSTNDYNERADIAQTFFDVMQSLPSSMIADNESIKSSNLKLDNLSDENLTKYINDIRQTGGNIPFDKMARILLFLLCIYAVSSVFTAAMQYIMSSVAQKVVYNMRKDVNEKLTRLPLKYFDSHANGDIISRMTNDMDTISTTLQQSLTQFIQAILQIIGYIIMMLTISPILTLIVMLTLPLYIIVTTLIAKKSQKFYAAQQKHLGDLSGHTEEMYTGHMIIKAFGQEENSIEIFESANDKLYNAGWKAQFFSGVMFPLMNFISNFGYVLISVVGGIFVTKTWLNIGDITAFIQYSRQFTMPIIQTANIANIIQSTVACSERVFEILDEEEELADSKDAKIIKYPHGDIVFDHVKFSYKESEPLIEDMNLNIKKGETIAIVGPTGAGKTTLVNLLMRFYEINGGSITFDGIDIRDIKRGNLRTMFGMVLQDTWLFNGTIEQNILYGRQDATSEEVISAAKAAHADHFIRSLPEGYKTVLNEEASNISQGQKQLLTIARAILANPSVLILDEATSSVDTRTEVLIQKAMGKLMEGRTNFVIAHRLSTIRDAKLILVMNRGSIIESGTHQELLDKKGFYYELYNSQFAAPSIG